ATMLRGRGSLQDIDQTALIAPHVKWYARPNTLREVAPALEEAFDEAQSGVPGPVFVELAVDLLYEESTVREWYKKQTDKPNNTPFEHALSFYVRGHLKNVFAGAPLPVIGPKSTPEIPKPHRTDLRRAASMFERAEKPLLVIGSQAMLNPPQVRALVGAIEK